jgi:PAS domain S-box-containing protein
MKSMVARTNEEEVLNILSEQAPVGVCIVQDGKFCYVNSYFSTVTGYTADELVGRDSYMLIVPEDRDMSRDNCIKMLKGELLSPYQFRVTCKDGRIIWVMSTVKSIQYHGSLAILGNYMEITEREHVERQIQESERHYRLLAENAEDVIWTVDVACPTRLTYISPSVTRLLGYSVEETMAKEMEAVFTPASFNSAMKAFAEEMAREQKGHAAQHRTRRLELQLRHKDGSLIDVEVNYSFIRGFDGQKDEILAVARDITERKQAENQLEESREKYWTLVEKGNDAIVIIQDGLLAFANSWTTNITGFPQEELIGRSFINFISPAYKSLTAERYNRRIVGKKAPDRYEIEILSKDGRNVPVEISASVIEYEGRPADMAVIRDITERKRAEEAIREREERYRRLADSITDVFFALDKHLRYTYWNKASEVLTGIRAENAIGKSLPQIFPDTPGIRRAKKVYHEVLRTQQPQTFITDYTNRDGKHYIFEISAYPSQGGISVFVKDVTEHKQAEEKLLESEERYRALFDRSLDCIFIHDLEGNFLDANKTALKLLGYKSRDVSHLNFVSLLSQDQLPKALATLQELKDTGVQKQANEFRLRCKNGSFVDVEVIAAIIYHNGKPYAVQGVGRDITEHKQADEKLKESEHKYRTILEEMGDGYFETDLAGNITFINDALIRILGYSKEEMIGMNFRAIRPKEHVKAIFEASNRMYKTGEPLRDRPAEVICKDGRHAFAETSAFPIRNGTGDIIGFRGIHRDITERKQVEEALQKSEERYRVLAENAGEAILVVQDDVIKYINPKGVELCGYSGEELASRSFTKFIYPDDIDMVADRYLSRLRGEVVPQTYDFRIIRKDGDIRWGELNSVPISWEDRPAVLCFMSDITERKQAVEALRQSEERYRSILEEMEDAYFEVDLGGHFTFVNDSVCRDLGYSREELIGKSYKDYTDEEDIESVFRVFNEVYRTGVPNKGFPWKTTRKDGSHGFAETSVSPLRDNKGEIIGFRGVGRDITERKQAEEAFNLQRAYFQQLFDNSPDAIVMLDINDRLSHANRGFEALFGYSTEEIQGQSLRGLIVPEEDEDATSASIQKVFSGEVVRRETIRIRKDGSLVDVSTLSYPIQLNGKVVGACFTYTDITQRKQAEEKLQQSEENYKTLFNSSVVGMYVMDADTMKVVMGNRAAQEMVGFSSAEEGIGVNPFDFVVPEDREKVLEIAINEFLQDSRQTHEIQIMDKNGRKRWQSISIARITHKGRLSSLVSFTDVTERKQAEEALRQSEENYRALFDSTVIGTIVLDAETMKVAMANQAAVEMFGFSSPEERIGLNPVDFIPPEDKEMTLEIIMKELFEQDLRTTREFRAITKDGREIWISATGARIMHEGRLAGLISFTDITEQKRQNERLMMTDRLASIGELAAGAAHELNNPLTTITGFSQLLMEKEIPDDIREDLKLINNEAQRAANVTKNLLTFARKHTPVKQLNQINNIIEDILKLRAYEHKANGIEVKRQLAPNIPEIMVDYFQMQQVLLNIIINAEYFITDAHNRGTLTIATQKQNSTVIISIADDGPGIPSENLSRLFDPFFTTKEAGKGTGLGLSICHGIVTEHGGQIYARTQQGKGATIVVELPINGH